MKNNSQSLGAADLSPLTFHLDRERPGLRTPVIRVLLLLLLATLARNSLAESAVVSNSEPFIAERGPHHRVWERISTFRSGDGTIITRTNRAYTELQANLHRNIDGAWIENKDEIELFEDGAVARQGSHQAIFSANVNSPGALDFQASDGTRFQWHVLGVAYYTGDGQSAWVGLLRDTIGELHPPNRIVYADCFEGIRASISYTYKKSGVEQDILILEQLPHPSVFGLRAEDTHVEIVTEFINPAQPVKTERQVSGGIDQRLDFGLMAMGRSAAFLVSDPGQTINVAREWHQGDRSYVTESVPYSRLAKYMAALPAPQAGVGKPAKNTPNTTANGLVRGGNNKADTLTIRGRGGAKVENVAIGKVTERRILPAAPTQKKKGEKIKLLASARLPEQALVMDFDLTQPLTNFTFAAQETYYVSGEITIRGTNIFEGGSVLKFTNTARLTSSGTNIFKTGPYAPCILTSKDDNTVGAGIVGSTGNPNTNYYRYGIWFDTNPGPLIQHFHVRFATNGLGFSEWTTTVRNCQFVSCDIGVWNDYSSMNVENTLFYRVKKPISGTAALTVRGAHLTAHECQYASYIVDDENPGYFYITNSIFVNCTNWFGPGHIEGSSNSTHRGTDSSIFTSVGAASHYLAANSPYRNAGNTNLSATLLAQRRSQTTYPPLLLTNKITIDTTLTPQAQRDADVPDLGYAYDPIDFAVALLEVTNAAVTMTNGVVVATYDQAGLWLQDNSRLFCEGTPLNRNRFCWYMTAQEQATNWGTAGSHIMVNNYHYGSSAATASFRFSSFNMVGGIGTPINGFPDGWTFASLTLRDCEFISGHANFVGRTNDSIALTNNLFWGTDCSFWGGTPALWAYNNLFRSSDIYVEKGDGTNTWTFKDNAFDSVSLMELGYETTNTHNAYINGSGRLNPGTAPSDIVVSSFTNHTGLLGYWYQPTNSALTNKGSRLASAAMLYHYTVHTNQVKETNSTVDIGYHYMALDANGNPQDADSDGYPDYFEDANGDGDVISDSGETDWQSAGDGGLRVFITRPREGSNVP